MASRVRIGRRVRDGLLALFGLVALGLAAGLVLSLTRDRAVKLRLTAGQEAGRRHRIAQDLRREAIRRQIEIDLYPTAGSAEALQAVQSAIVDAALVQGGLDMSDLPGLRQVAALQVEPLHLLVKEELHPAVTLNLGGLRGKVVNLGEHGSGTYLLSTEVMAFLGLRAGTDFVESTYSYADLETESDRGRLPDAVFTVSLPPSPIARHLVTKHRYRLASLPFCDAFALGAFDGDHAAGSTTAQAAVRVDRRHVYDETIPALTYKIEPAVPPERIHTLGTRLLVVARSDISPTTIRRLLEVIFNSPFAQVFQPPLDARILELPPEISWHDGTTEYIRRNSPLIAGDAIDVIEKEASIIGVGVSIIGGVAGGLFFLIPWLRRRFRRRRDRCFQAYILQVANVERQALALSREPALDLPELLRLQDDLTRLKGDALERFARGELDGEELMSGFLVHASDTRDFLVRLILHQRENLEDRARTQDRPAEVLWNEAVGEPDRPAQACPTGSPVS